MKNKIEVENLKIITKDNFQSELEQFKKLLKSNLFEYIIINNDFSTTNKKSTKEKENEIIFSEFTICRRQNLESKDIHYTFTTFLVPAIKFHRYYMSKTKPRIKRYSLHLYYLFSPCN